MYINIQINGVITPENLEKLAGLIDEQPPMPCPPLVAPEPEEKPKASTPKRKTRAKTKAEKEAEKAEHESSAVEEVSEDDIEL